ncbi:MAG TPA: hypothetical protein DFI00_00985 [Rhodospirillaceae bacterium]|nr:hypothetical protein [Alphaproteobacteria bacterium]OUT42168.1 MAG: hypothetical protein CBB62_07695 [Micavibrio sp. TMED2]HCI45847.1 hypothetical protein [Rhodospirillaceae bacterium]MAS46216.1 hypothetical protein [Alphaproteobacteria bacterium]MAX95601.1 hypothetical protein [Alphaproteobacteria bacterium]|tara:strand:- start:173 stop:829 length:657 start_codon:yes stop_codon:yes gene_type:complete
MSGIRHIQRALAACFTGVLALGIGVAAEAADRAVIQMTLLDSPDGIGRIVMTDIAGGGVSIDPLLKNLPPGDHMLVVRPVPDCDAVDSAAAGHLNPVTSGVYDDRGERGEMAVNSPARATRLAASNTAFLQQLNDDPQIEFTADDVPLAPDYSREEVRLALGDLPDIVVNQHGQATQISYAPLIAVAQLYGHSLIIKQKTEVGQVIIACGPISYPARP